MALFSSAVDKFLFSFPIPRFLFRKICSTTEMLPAKEAWRISLGKLYSPEFGEGEFSEVRASATRSRNVRGWYVGTPPRAQHAGPGSAARSPQPLGPPLV